MTSVVPGHPTHPYSLARLCICTAVCFACYFHPGVLLGLNLTLEVKASFNYFHYKFA